jgi:hypothetical protein
MVNLRNRHQPQPVPPVPPPVPPARGRGGCAGLQGQGIVAGLLLRTIQNGNPMTKPSTKRSKQ